MSVTWSRRDLAKYPFSTQAIRFIDTLGITLDQLESPEMARVVDRAVERAREALRYAIVEPNWDDDLVEILSFPTAIALISYLRDRYAERRYALAEARRAYLLLQEEEIPRLVDLAKHTFGWKIRPLGDSEQRLAINLSTYLRNASTFHDPYWKLVNREMILGEIIITKTEAARLLQEEIQRKLLERFKPVELPPTLAKSADILRSELGQLQEELSKPLKLEKLNFDALPPCIKNIIKKISDTGHASHVERFTLASFLIAINTPADDILSIFSKLSDFDEKKTRYQIEHIAGVRGSRTKYTPPSCDTLKTHGLCVSSREACGGIRHPLAYYIRASKKSRNERR